MLMVHFWEQSSCMSTYKCINIWCVYKVCMSSNPINRTSAIHCFEDNNAVKIHDVNYSIAIWSYHKSKSILSMHVDYFICLKVTQLVLEAQVKLFLAKSVYAYYNFEMPELMYANNSQKRNIVLPSYNYLSLTCLHAINTSQLQSLLSLEQEGQLCQETLSLRCLHLPCW